MAYCNVYILPVTINYRVRSNLNNYIDLPT